MKSYFILWLCCGFWLCADACYHNSSVVNMILDASGSKEKGAQVTFLDKRFNVTRSSCFEECCKMNIRDHCNMANFITEKSNKTMKITEASVRGNCTLISCVPFSSCRLMPSISLCYTLILNTTVISESSSKKKDQDISSALRDVLQIIKGNDKHSNVENVTSKAGKLVHQVDQADQANEPSNFPSSSSKESLPNNLGAAEKILSGTKPRKGVSTTSEMKFSKKPTSLSGSKARKGVTNIPSNQAATDTSNGNSEFSSESKVTSVTDSNESRFESDQQSNTEKDVQLSSEKDIQSSTEKYIQSSTENLMQSSSEKYIQSSTENLMQSSTEKDIQSSTEKAMQSSIIKGTQSSTMATVNLTKSILVTGMTLTSQNSVRPTTGSTEHLPAAKITTMSSKKLTPVQSPSSKPSTSKVSEAHMSHPSSDKPVSIKPLPIVTKFRKVTRPISDYRSSTQKPTKNVSQIISSADVKSKTGAQLDEQENPNSSKAPPNYIIISIICGIVIFVIVIAVITRAAYESWQKRHYRRMDFLVDGMYD